MAFWSDEQRTCVTCDRTAEHLLTTNTSLCFPVSSRNPQLQLTGHVRTVQQVAVDQDALTCGMQAKQVQLTSEP